MIIVLRDILSGITITSLGILFPDNAGIFIAGNILPSNPTPTILRHKFRHTASTKLAVRKYACTLFPCLTKFLLEVFIRTWNRGEYMTVEHGDVKVSTGIPKRDKRAEDGVILLKRRTF